MADLPRMDDRQFRRAKRLIRRLCANYDNGNCLLLDNGEVCPCPQLITPVVICRYFRAAVLPSDRALWSGIMDGKPVKSCRVCGAPIFSVSNAAKYCPACALRVRRKKDAERKRNRPRTSANREPKSLLPRGFQTDKPLPGKDLSPDGKNRL